MLASLSHDLNLSHDKGFSRSNLIRFRQFYVAFPNGATVSHQLSWSHVVELLKFDDPTRHKDELLVEYATYQLNSQLFVQKYQLYLPDREELRRQLEITLKQAGKEKMGNMPGDSATEAQP